MDAGVIRDMMQTPYMWEALINISGAGDKTYDTPVAFKGYPVIKQQLVADVNGEQRYSTTQVFIASHDIALMVEGDNIIEVSSVKSYPVLKRDFYYRRNGILDYGVIYI
jgi:hypothetical protein